MPEVTLFQPTGQRHSCKQQLQQAWWMFSLKQRGPGFLARCKRDITHACTALTFSSFGMFPPPSESKDLMISEYNFGQSMTQRDCLTFVLWEFNFRFFMVSCWCYSLGNQVGLSSVIVYDIDAVWSISFLFSTTVDFSTRYVFLFSTCIQHL
jgi:hypothetical protein